MELHEAPEARPAPDGPLAGVRILAVEQVVAMPYATQLLARLGADVVKIEHPVTGDSGRHSQPTLRDDDGRLVGAPYIRSNLHKRSVGLDLKSAEGKALFLSLVEHFDVVADNMRPGTMTRLGLDPGELLARYPRLVYVSVSGFGSDPGSPYYSWPAYAPTAEAMAGFGESVRKPGQPPAMGGAGALGDIGTALFACIGLLAALRQRDRTGRGQHVDVAMYDAMMAMADHVPFMWSMSGGDSSGRSGPTSVTGAFAAADGYFIMLAREPQFPALARLVGHEEWSGDPAWGRQGAWKERTESHIRPALEGWASGKTKLEAAHELCALGIAAGPSNTAPDIAGDPHVALHQMLVEVPRPDGGQPMLVVANPIKLSATQPDKRAARWPMLGQHTYEVLAQELDLPARELDALAARGVITQPGACADPG
jgi:crotonobetainyl-CoA:carnitine CoA-transferase CaiB-like acyl-CoA transferase